MCLSTIYIKDEQEQKEVASNIMNVTQDGNKVICTNLLGVKQEFKGIIASINLMDNYVIIQSTK